MKTILSRRLLLLGLLWVPTHARSATAPLNRVTDLKEFLKRFEQSWRGRNAQELARVMNSTFFYGNSDDGLDYVAVKHKHAGEFLRRLFATGDVRFKGGQKEEGTFWASTFRSSWEPKLKRESVGRGKNGFRGMDDYDAYAILRLAPELVVFFKKPGCHWRIRGFYRNSA